MLLISLGLCHTWKHFWLDALEYYLEKSLQGKNNITASVAVTSPLRHSEHTHWASRQENMQMFTLATDSFHSWYLPGPGYRVGRLPKARAGSSMKPST